MKCFYCKIEFLELRPYGPNGAMVCFACAMSTPERKSLTEKMFGYASDQSPIMILCDDGLKTPEEFEQKSLEQN